MGDLVGEEVWVVRLYLAQTAERNELLFRRLRRWEKLRGATVIEAKTGFGEHGLPAADSAPIVIEFFERPEVAQRVIKDLSDVVDHIVYWPANTPAKPFSP